MATPTTFVDATARTTREAEQTVADWDNGMNMGSCSPGVGINIGGGALPAIDAPGQAGYSWTLLDQDEVARTPQDSQSIGGIGLNAGAETNQPILTISAQADAGDGTVTLGTAATLTTLAAGWVLGA